MLINPSLDQPIMFYLKTMLPEHKKVLNFSSTAGKRSSTYVDSSCFMLLKNRPGSQCALRIHHLMNFVCRCIV